MKEVSVGEALVAWLEENHWDVYQEVQFRSGGGVADIAAVRSGVLWIVECKTSLTFAVMEQATGWRAHFRSVAVPYARKRRVSAIHVARSHFKIGVLEMDPYGTGMAVRSSAPLMREYHRFAKGMIGDLLPEHKTYAKAGSKGASHYTHYKGTMNDVRAYIYDHPDCTLKEVMADTSHHYAHDASARSNIPKALRSWEEDWCEVVEGRPLRFRVRQSWINENPDDQRVRRLTNRRRPHADGMIADRGGRIG